MGFLLLPLLLRLQLLLLEKISFDVSVCVAPVGANSKQLQIERRSPPPWDVCESTKALREIATRHPTCAYPLETEAPFMASNINALLTFQEGSSAPAPFLGSRSLSDSLDVGISSC